MKTKNKILAIFLLILLIGVSFFRDFCFKNINALLSHKFYNSPENYADESISFLFSLTYKEVYITKWLLLALFSLFFYLLTWGILHFTFDQLQKKIKKFVFLTYASIGLIIGIVVLLFFIPGISNQSYMVARRLLGILHSPIPVMVYFLIFKIQAKLDQKENLKPE